MCHTGSCVCCCTGPTDMPVSCGLGRCADWLLLPTLSSCGSDHSVLGTSCVCGAGRSGGCSKTEVVDGTASKGSTDETLCNQHSIVSVQQSYVCEGERTWQDSLLLTCTPPVAPDLLSGALATLGVCCTLHVTCSLDKGIGHSIVT